MFDRAWHRVTAGAVAVMLATLAACGGDDEDVSQFQRAADSLMTRRDTALSRMDSAGVIRADTLSADSTKRADSARRDTAGRRP